jgi:hypothetical protein
MGTNFALDRVHSPLCSRRDRVCLPRRNLAGGDLAHHIKLARSQFRQVHRLDLPAVGTSGISGLLLLLDFLAFWHDRQASAGCASCAIGDGASFAELLDYSSDDLAFRLRKMRKFVFEAWLTKKSVSIELPAPVSQDLMTLLRLAYFPHRRIAAFTIALA